MKTSCSKHTCLGSCWQARRGIFWYLNSRLPLLRSLTGDFGFLRGDFSAAGLLRAALLPPSCPSAGSAGLGAGTTAPCPPTGPGEGSGRWQSCAQRGTGRAVNWCRRHRCFPAAASAQRLVPLMGSCRVCARGVFLCQPHRCRRSTAQLTPPWRGSGDVPAGLSDPQLLAARVVLAGPAVFWMALGQRRQRSGFPWSLRTVPREQSWFGCWEAQG